MGDSAIAGNELCNSTINTVVIGKLRHTDVVAKAVPTIGREGIPICIADTKNIDSTIFESFCELEVMGRVVWGDEDEIHRVPLGIMLLYTEKSFNESKTLFVCYTTGMKKEYVKHHSTSLDYEMEVAIYGHDGLPIIAFPTQNSKARNYEDFGIVNEISWAIESGRVQMFVVDTIDEQSWSLENGENSWRSARQEQYFHFIVDELYPFVKQKNGTGKLPVTYGCSMGANHALNVFLRRPELFSGVLALSGVYDSGCFFQNGWCDRNLYDNSPEMYLRNMDMNHPYIDIYNSKRIIICVGQGGYEEQGIRTLRYLEETFRLKGIHAWCDFWGYDVNHDWPWWFKQTNYFLPYLLGD